MSGLPGTVYSADAGFGKFVGQMVNYTYRMLGSGENLLHGVKLTLLLTTLSMAIGSVLSVFPCIGQNFRKSCGQQSQQRIYLFLSRDAFADSAVCCIFLRPRNVRFFPGEAYLAMSDPEAVYKGAFIAALIAFSLNAAAYCAEIVRAAIQSIDKGQNEAAKALGMSYGQTMRTIIIPQSIRRMIPPLCNEFVMMIKGRLACVRHIADGHYNDFEIHYDKRRQLSGFLPRADYLFDHNCDLYIFVRQD